MRIEMEQPPLNEPIPAFDDSDANRRSGYRTAAVIYLIGAVPGATYFVTKDKWIICTILVLFAILVAKMLLDLRRGWAKFILVVSPFAVLLGLVSLIRHGVHPSELFSLLAMSAYTACMYLLLLRPPSRALRIAAVLLFLLVSLPLNIAWVVARLR